MKFSLILPHNFHIVPWPWDGNSYSRSHIYKKKCTSFKSYHNKKFTPGAHIQGMSILPEKRDLTGSCFVTETPLEISGRPCCIPEMESCFLENSLYNLAILYRLVFVYLRVCICAPVYLYVSVFFFTYIHTHIQVIHPIVLLVSHSFILPFVC